MKHFHTLQTNMARPEQFNDPFDYEPHPLSILAVEEVQQYIMEHPEIKEDADQGKMFGVLVVAPLRGYSRSVECGTFGAARAKDAGINLAESRQKSTKLRRILRGVWSVECGVRLASETKDSQKVESFSA